MIKFVTQVVTQLVSFRWSLRSQINIFYLKMAK